MKGGKMIMNIPILIVTFVFQSVEIPKFESVPDTYDIIAKYYPGIPDSMLSIHTRWPGADEIYKYGVDIESFRYADSLLENCTHYLKLILKENFIPRNIEEWYYALRQWPAFELKFKTASPYLIDVIIARWKVNGTIVQMIERGESIELMIAPPVVCEIAPDLRSYIEECLIYYFNFPEEKLQNVKWIDSLPVSGYYEEDTVLVMSNGGQWQNIRTCKGLIMYKKMSIHDILEADTITPDWWQYIYFWTDGRIFWAAFRKVDGAAISPTMYFNRTGLTPPRFLPRQ